ncbi:hypothetical protein MJO29_013645, partial [Puccinia striiformis f. sp. tritici]
CEVGAGLSGWLRVVHSSPRWDDIGLSRKEQAVQRAPKPPTKHHFQLFTIYPTSMSGAQGLLGFHSLLQETDKLINLHYLTLEKGKKGLGDGTCPYGLANGNDITITMWNDTIIAPSNVQFLVFLFYLDSTSIISSSVTVNFLPITFAKNGTRNVKKHDELKTYTCIFKLSFHENRIYYFKITWGDCPDFPPSVFFLTKINLPCVNATGEVIPHFLSFINLTSKIKKKLISDYQFIVEPSKFLVLSGWKQNYTLETVLVELQSREMLRAAR